MGNFRTDLASTEPPRATAWEEASLCSPCDLCATAANGKGGGPLPGTGSRALCPHPPNVPRHLHCFRHLVAVLRTPARVLSRQEQLRLQLPLAGGERRQHAVLPAGACAVQHCLRFGSLPWALREAETTTLMLLIRGQRRQSRSAVTQGSGAGTPACGPEGKSSLSSRPEPHTWSRPTAGPDVLEAGGAPQSTAPHGC